MPQELPNKYSELRQDIVSGDWVVVATGRAKRPNDFVAKKKPKISLPKKVCPFDKLEDSALLLITKDGAEFHSQDEAGSKVKDWFIEVTPNKFPAFAPHHDCPVVESRGIYRMAEGGGFHELIVIRPHERSIALLSVSETVLVIRAYQRRFQVLGLEECVKYIAVIHNHGQAAGASIVHPHSQLIAIPVVPPDVQRSLNGSERYFIEKKGCVHCAMVAFEMKDRERIIFENEHFVAFAPYASRGAFEIRIFPKLHSAEFQNISEDEIPAFAEVLQRSLAVLYHGLGDPSYNFFIHTAPTDGGRGYGHYHWHVEILPKTATWGGFEFGTGIEISTIAPEEAAKFLRSVNLPVDPVSLSHF
ncbi:MAG: hypothetical protein A3C11_02940 [Candidatus Sungbacteria bacterium RIFCSPHIGHO2_02_FULL_49_12]|uniref:DUF4921 domain-containing protein n=1 Tax=Candidatus Sungbacteria bacterium RIFCSPHIGHO2_02_FULL_49_12 TaxID=1802271 RepID=A0A1G2KMB6_9BACT|nr:MAG: hypothetical protein A3C11_02940 [Candidatus Sungbacteria bacterium RIFCSPHIGHO2_02_FULL_49_12]